MKREKLNTGRQHIKPNLLTEVGRRIRDAFLFRFTNLDFDFQLSMKYNYSIKNEIEILKYSHSLFTKQMELK